MDSFKKKTAGKIKTSQPVGHQVLIELLNPQETLDTVLQISDDFKTDTPQGYVVGVGPMVPKEFGVNIGDRVFLSSSSAVMSPGNLGNNNRKLFCVEYNTIKGILREE